MAYINASGKLYTIGYSGFTINTFIEKINLFNINCIIDVRSCPYSKRFEEFNKENLEYLVKNRDLWKNKKIWYLHLPKEFGARQTDPLYFHEKEKYVDFEKFRSSQYFLEGCERIKKGLSQGYNSVLICAEIEPSPCHRSIMISRWFDLHKYKVLHILPDGIKDQESVNNELLKKYFKDEYAENGFTGSLLDMDKSAEELRKERLREAFAKRNREIAFRVTEG